MKRVTIAADGRTVANVEQVDAATPPPADGAVAIEVADAAWVGPGLFWNGDRIAPAFAPAA